MFLHPLRYKIWLHVVESWSALVGHMPRARNRLLLKAIVILLLQHSLAQWFSCFTRHQNHVEILLKHRLLAPLFQVFNLVDLGYKPKIFISDVKYSCCKGEVDKKRQCGFLTKVHSQANHVYIKEHVKVRKWTLVSLKSFMPFVSIVLVTCLWYSDEIWLGTDCWLGGFTVVWGYLGAKLCGTITYLSGP